MASTARPRQAARWLAAIVLLLAGLTIIGDVWAVIVEAMTGGVLSGLLRKRDASFDTTPGLREALGG